MLAQTDHQLSELDRTLPKRHQSTVSVPCPYEARGTVMRKAMEHSEGMQRLLVDGVRVSKDGVTVLLAPDKEEALFTITAEADSADQARSTRDTYAELVTQWRDGQ